MEATTNYIFYFETLVKDGVVYGIDAVLLNPVNGECCDSFTARCSFDGIAYGVKAGVTIVSYKQLLGDFTKFRLLATAGKSVDVITNDITSSNKLMADLNRYGFGTFSLLDGFDEQLNEVTNGSIDSHGFLVKDWELPLDDDAPVPAEFIIEHVYNRIQ